MIYPPVTILMTTYFPSDGGRERRSLAYKALSSWGENLQYAGELLLHVADDGSSWEFNCSSYWRDGFISFSQQQRQGYGSSLNAGLREIFKHTSFVLHAVDDWYLTNPFNLNPWVEMLLTREDVGMIRLGPPHPNISGKAQMLTTNWQGWGLVLDRQSFAFGLRPCLIHKRFIDAYGWFAENTSALESERLYNEHFCQTSGPEIVLALPHSWEHLESESLSGLEPGK